MNWEKYETITKKVTKMLEKDTLNNKNNDNKYNSHKWRKNNKYNSYKWIKLMIISMIKAKNNGKIGNREN